MVPGEEEKKQGKPQGEVFWADLKYHPGEEMQFEGLLGGGQDMKGVGPGDILQHF